MPRIPRNFTVEGAEEYMKLAGKYFGLVVGSLERRHMQAYQLIEPGDDQRIQFWLLAAGTAAQMSQAISALVIAQQPATRPEQEITDALFGGPEYLGLEYRGFDEAAAAADVTVMSVKAIIDGFVTPNEDENEE